MQVPPGTVGVPVRLAEPTALALVRPGDRVDLLRVEEGGTTAPVAQGALVLGITGAADPLAADPLAADPLAARLPAGGLLLALDPGTAKRAVATPGNGFAVLLRPG